MGQLREVRHNHYNLPPEHATDFKAYQNDQILIYTTYNDIQKSDTSLVIILAHQYGDIW